MILTSRDNNSDMGSLYGSSDYLVAHENNNSTFKRERSVSPFSPAFSPVKSVQPKKRKLSSNRDEDEIPSTSQQIALSQSSSSECSIPALYENFKNAEFKEFLNIMREYIIDNDADAELEKSLVKATKNLWALKQLHRSMISHNGLKPSNGRDKFKRMSMRIKNILQQPLTTNTSESSNHLNSSKHRNSLTLEKPSTPRRPLNRPINEVIEDIFNLDSKYLFKGLARDPVCKYCFKPGGGLLRCAKECHNWLHKECKGKKESTVGKKGKRKYKSLGASQQDLSISSIMVNNELNSTLEQNTNTTAHITAETDEPPIVCEECERGEPICDICRINKPDEQLVACNMSQCGKYYHVLCCKYWPQTKITYSQNTIVSFRCASHVCHTCVSDDPKGKYQQLSNSKIVKCVKCPATYHADSTCIPAGTEIINASHIICPRHFLGKSDAHVNVNWCFICVNGGNVLCCETCPIAVHAACLNIPMDPDEGYICEECESGRLPLYGEMVWAKFNNFRWWPAIILPPTEVPQNIKKKPHNPLEFVVRFFGTHDHGWISRRRVYLYLEGDSSEPPKSKTSKLDNKK